jgi:hypothetical protein
MDTDILKHPAVIVFRTEVHLIGEDCTTNWKVTGSIPDGVIGNFH